jgi:hypothetical protein
MFEDAEGNRFALGQAEDADTPDVEIPEAAPTSG